MKSPQQTYTVVPLSIIVVLLFLPYALAASLLFCLVFALYLSLKYPASRGTFEKLVWGAFLLRLAVLVANEFFTFIPDQSDSIMYNRVAMETLDNISRQLPVFYDNIHSFSVKSYSLFLTLIYGIFGQVHMLAKLVNSFLSLLSGIVIYKLVREIFEHEKIALISAAVVLYLPSIIAFTSFVIRDAIVLYLTYLMLYYVVLAFKGKKRSLNTFIAFLVFIVISIMRIQNLYLYALFFILFALFLIFRSNIHVRFKMAIAVTIAVACTVFVLINMDFVFALITYPFRAQPHRIEGGSAYLTNMQYNSALDIFKFLPLRYIYFTYGPFLWQARGAFLLLSALEGLLVLFASILTLLYFVKEPIKKNMNLQLLLLFFCFTGLAANSIVDSNFGTAIRHRMIYIVFFFIFVSAYFHNKKLRVL